MRRASGVRSCLVQAQLVAGVGAVVELEWREAGAESKGAARGTRVDVTARMEVVVDLDTPGSRTEVVLGRVVLGAKAGAVRSGCRRDGDGGGVA